MSLQQDKEDVQIYQSFWKDLTIINDYFPPVEHITREQWENDVQKRKNKMDKYASPKILVSVESPFPICNFALFQNSGLIYLHGGEGRLSTKLDSLIQFEMKGISDTLFTALTCKNSPSACSNHTIVVDGKDSAFLFGGDTYSPSHSGEFHHLNIKTLEWSKLKTGPLPRSGHSSSFLNGQIFVFGGRDDQMIFNDLWSYDVEKKKWSKIKSLRDPSPRYDQLMYTIDKYIYVLGGCGEQEKPCKDIWRFDTQWSQMFMKSSFDQISSVEFYLPSKGGSGCAFGSKFVIYGGETLLENKEVDPYLTDFIIFDHENMTLSRSGDVQNSPLSCHKLVWNGDRILAIGGISSRGSFFNSFNQIISFPIENTFLENYILKGRVFDSTLDEIMIQSDQKGKIPILVEQTLQYLENNGVIEGIFRKNGRYTEVIQLALLYENEISFQIENLTDPHSVAGVLKRFLVSLQEPLLTYELHQDFIYCETVEQVKLTLKNLPSLNYQVCKRLFHFFHILDLNKDKTFMTWENIQIILGNALLRPKTTFGSSLDKSKVLCLLIQNYDKIFE